MTAPRQSTAAHRSVAAQPPAAARSPAPARPPVAGRALTFGLSQLVHQGLRGVWVRGELPAGAAVWAANHHSWWDGFVAAAVLRRQHRTAALLMDGDNLSAFRFLRSAGVISARSPRQALQALRDGRVLIVFPEGELCPPGPLHATARGAAWLGQNAPAAVVPVAVRVISRGQQYPEALVDIGPEVAPEQLPAALATRLRELDAVLLGADPRLPVPGFRRLVRGRLSWDERITRWAGAGRR